MSLKKRREVEKEKKPSAKRSGSVSDKGILDGKNVLSSPISFKKILERFVIVGGTYLLVSLYFKYWFPVDVLETLAPATEYVERYSENLPCSNDYEEDLLNWPECTPTECGRIIRDDVIDIEDAEHLLRTAKAGLALGGSNGGASILDLHSGALSKGDKFINIYKSIEESGEVVFTPEDFEVYRRVKDKIHGIISAEFGIPRQTLYLTNPTFFSRMTDKPSSTKHDEYWHLHVDKDTYGSFHYTCLLYLSTYGTDFGGGRFMFVSDERNVTVEPKLGRLSFFTSGTENPHYVEKVSSGTRYAITVSFTCDPDQAISDPKL